MKRVRPLFFDTVPEDGSPYIADIRTFDVPETIAACIRNAASGLAAITFSTMGGQEMVRRAEEAASRRGATVIWWRGPPAADAAELEAAIAAFEAEHP